MSFKNSIRSVLALSLLACVLVGSTVQPATGQVSAANVTGIVTDQTGAVLSNVTVAFYEYGSEHPRINND